MAAAEIVVVISDRSGFDYLRKGSIPSSDDPGLVDNPILVRDLARRASSCSEVCMTYYPNDTAIVKMDMQTVQKTETQQLGCDTYSRASAHLLHIQGASPVAQAQFASS